MRIAVINEGSTKHRNADVMKAVEELSGNEIFNLGMQNVDGEPDLTYLETALMSAIIINLKAVDFVVGGCGTGQGYMNAVLMFPGTACGLLVDPVDAFLFSQVNAGNVISLALNKGYGGVGGDINVKYILKTLFNDTYGQGYPQHRAELQINARKKMAQLSEDSHLPMKEILEKIDPLTLEHALKFPGFLDFIKNEAPESDLKDYVLSRA